MCHCHSQSSCHSSSCSSQSQGCPCSCHKGAGGGCGQNAHGSQPSCEYAVKFLELADQAWMEVLKEKIKDHIRLNSKNIDELAAIVSEANHERWQKKMENRQACGNFEERLKNFFHSSSCCSKK